ncbi:ribonuclease E inhibitor RraB [Shewanella marinintestina]|uniref:ribonuclease E inhibitor RraB n=1 Tax=Shewanella marinintestina TaxID=190305 RepID=UPI00200D34FF|nr:ribonuclease E inhibitor RraB [Shewanella marinintestina]MCL1144413.1 ribonuclease E inhibitor RraB [Shewanella marinintestina]
MEEYPDDVDGNILQNLAASGFDMSRLRDFEFFVDSPDEESSYNIEKELIKAGFSTEVYFDEGELEEGETKTEENKEFWPSWTVYVLSKMAPDYNEIIRIQEVVDAIAKPFNGRSDGWEIEIAEST